MNDTPSSDSPRWSTLTKQVVALSMIVILGALLVRFKNLVVPVLMAFVIAYLLHPPVTWICRKSRISWRAAVSIIYLIFVLGLIALLTWGGVGVVGQIGNLIDAIQENVNALPGFLEELTRTGITIGPFHLDLSQYEWGDLVDRALGYVEPVLGRLGSLIGSLAGSAATTIGWLFFIIVVSYFFMLESGGLRNRIIQIKIPFYTGDFRRLGKELGNIWNAYLRGQMIVFFLTVVVYTVFLTILGVRYSFVLALVAGFGTFLPYIGPAILWIVLGLMTYFQDATIFGLTHFWYMVLVIAIGFIIDQIFNNLVTPRVMANVLKVHPAFVLIAAIIAASLVGVVGVILAAPLLATAQLFITYIVRKMLDRDPFPEKKEPPPPEKRQWFLVRFISWLRGMLRSKKKSSTPEEKGETNVQE